MSAPGATRRPFGYLRDPLFISCVATYALNRFVLRPLFPPDRVPFLHEHFNDLICIPFWLPGVVLIYRKLGLRKHDLPPTCGEILAHLVIWSIWFEVLGPRIPPFRGHTVADPWDVAYYSVGALGAAIVWNWRTLRDWRRLLA